MTPPRSARPGKRIRKSIMAFCLFIILLPFIFPPPVDASNGSNGGDFLYIAVAGPMSGPEKHHGRETVNMIEMRLDEINKSGGVNGKKLKRLVFDDGNDVEKAVKAARKIAENDDILLVIGHRYSNTSIAAGKIYKERGIPAITATATAEMVTKGNDWCFRVVFNNRRQGSLLSTYVSRILGRNIASIVHDEDDFGKSLANAFEDASREHGLTVNYKWSFDRNKKDLEKHLSDIVDELSETRNCGIIFLAVHEKEGVFLIKKIRELGVNTPLIGSDALGKQSFPLGFKDFPMEKINPGVGADDLHVAAYFLSDTTDQIGARVHDRYVATYEKEPNPAAMVVFDAVSLGIEAMVRTGVKGENPSRDRRKIRDFLAGVNGMNSAYRGVTGYIYFDKEGDAMKTIPIGVFKNNRLISAPVQLNPVKDFKEFQQTESHGMTTGAVDGQGAPDSDVLLINGMHMQKTNYVYTGIEINEISSLEVNKLLFDMDFYLWLRFQEGVEPWRIMFLNSAEPVRLEKHIDEKRSGRVLYRKYHVKGRFKADFLSRAPAFGRHVLGVAFRHENLDRDKLVYIVDELGMGRKRNTRIRKKDVHFLSPSSGWAVSRVDFFQDVQQKKSMGDPEHLGKREGKVDYSRFNLEIVIEKLQVTLRGVIKSTPINTVLCAISIVMILATAYLVKPGKYGSFMRPILIAEIVFTGLFFLSAEALVLDALAGKTVVYNLGMIKLIFDILWWLAPAYFINQAIRLFIVAPLEKRTDRKVPSLLIYFVKFVIYTLAIFGIVAFVFDQKLTSLLATSGVLAMIVGLAIQINISNIFSGIAINLERSFRVGDHVKIGSEHGNVADITWRTTRINTVDGNIVSIPNSNASEAVVVNYSYPDDTHWQGFSVHLDYSRDPEKVKALMLDALNSVEGILASTVIFNGFTEWSSEYRVNFKIEDFSQRVAYMEAVWERVWKKLNSQGIRPAVNL